MKCGKNDKLYWNNCVGFVCYSCDKKAHEKWLKDNKEFLTNFHNLEGDSAEARCINSI